VHRLIRDRPLEFDAAAVRREFEPLLEEAKAADLERAGLRDRYIVSNRETAELIGVDLGAFGWML
jgi:hypothetical protein